MQKLVIKITDRGTNYTNQENGESHLSPTGHMWWELHESNGQVTSYGFAPITEGSPRGPGEVKYDDNTAYEFNESQGDYKREFEITQEQMDKLKEFGANPFEGENKFSSTYNGITNSCIDFTYKALDIIDFVPEGYDGDVWPTLNIDTIRAIPSSNSTDSQIFIGKEGGLFILDNKNQMTVKLFGTASEVDYAKTNSLATNAAKLGSNKVSIKDSNNQEVAKFDVKEGDQTYVFNSSALLKEEAKFFNKNGEEISQSNAIIKLEDTELGKLTVIRTDLTVTLKDNTTSTLGTVLDAIPKFLLGSASFGADLLKAASEIFDNERPAIVDEYGNPVLDADGNQTYGPSDLDYMIGEFVARIANDNFLIEPKRQKLNFKKG